MMGVRSTASDAGLLVDAGPNCGQRQKDAYDSQNLVPEFGSSGHELQQSKDGYASISKTPGDQVAYHVPGMTIV